MANSGGHASCMGTTIGGYEVLSHIGRGAMGVVYLARDIKLNRRAALKVLLGSLARNPAAIKRFHLEAQAAAPLRHPNIVRIYAAGVDEGIPYIAMEYVEGEPLDRFLRRKGQIKWQNALYIAQQVAEALECAHRSGVIHRDIKPANIMLDRQGRVRLTDFGIANVKQPNGALPEDTGTLATPQYMPPEQCRGQALYPASDLFALGVTLYHMLTGEMPFHGESSPALIKSITNDEPPRVNRLVPDIPDDVARLVAHLLAKQPEERPESAQAVCDRIDEIQSHKGGVSAMPAALTAFIKEQAQPRSVENDHPTPKLKRRSAIRKRTAASRASRRPMRLAALAAAVLIALTVVIAFTSYSFATRGTAWPSPAPQFEAIRFKRQFAPPVLTASLNGDAFACEEVAWVGAEPVLLVRVGGRQGALTQGLQALITVEPAELRASTLMGPQAGAGGAFPAGGGFRAASFAVPVTPSDSPFHNAVLMEHQQGVNQVIAVAQSWNEAAPRPQVLCQTATLGNAPSVEQLWQPGTLPAVTSPDGYTVCLLKREDPDGGEYLVQRDVRRLPLNETGEHLTNAGAPFVRQSLRYAPDGRRLAYIREKTPSERELWVVETSGGRIDGVPLIIGPLGDAAAFDPTGRRVAVTRHSAEGEPEVYLLQALSNPEPERMGKGLVCAESWTPSGDFLIVAARPEAADEAAPVEDAPYQLYAISTAPPYARMRLTDVPGGIRPIIAVSRDGVWAAAVADVAVPATLVFVTLDDLRLDMFAAERPLNGG